MNWAGDINGDGYEDLVIGAQEADPDGQIAAGETYLIYGSAGLPEVISLDMADVRFTGINEYDISGFSVSGVGDANGDGFADLLIGAHSANPNGNSSAGESYLVFGAPDLPPVVGLETADVRFQGIDSGDNSGYSVSGAGDVNGDGYEDLLIGAESADPAGYWSAGESYLIYGALNFPDVLNLSDADIRFEGFESDARSGRSVSGAGDINGDGYADILIGAYHADPNDESNAGEAYLFYGGPALPEIIDLASADVRLSGAEPGATAAHSVRGVGDVDGDGYSDLLIGAPAAPHDGVGAVGVVYLIYGSSSLPTDMSLAQASARFGGAAANDQAGWALGGAGDVNADGFSDLLISARYADPDGSLNSGETYLVLGGPGLLGSHELVAADVRFSGASPNDGSGWAVSHAGDINADGYGDILIGVRGADPDGLTNAGSTYLLLGADITASTTVLGTPDDDELFASNGPIVKDVIVAGEGVDRISSDGGPDVLWAGGGDDTLVVSDELFFRVDGGSGLDTLELATGVNLSQISLSPPRVTSIERIQLSPTGSSSVVISELALVNLSESTNILTIDGGGDDEVVLASGGWIGPVVDGLYMVYASETTAAVLRVGLAVSVTGE